MFKGINYENKDIRKSTEDIINNGFGAFNGQDDITPGENLDSIVNNTAETKDRLQDADGRSAAMLIRQLLDSTKRVTLSELAVKIIVNDTPDLNDLKDQFNNWKAGNPSVTPVFCLPFETGSPSLFILYY